MNPNLGLRATVARSFDPVVLIIAAIVLVLDQVTKAIIVATIAPPGPRSVEVAGDFIRLSFVTNTGAAFGLFEGRAEALAVVSLIAVPALLLSRAYLSDQRLLMRICLGMLVGGALGNLIDRIRLGYVVDFVDVGIGSLRWPSFNVADSSFVVGVIVIIALSTIFSAAKRAEVSEPRSS